MSVAFIDLDRTLLRKASGPALNRALMASGVLKERRILPGESLLFSVFDRIGENAASMGLARAAARLAKGWSQEEARSAGRLAVPELLCCRPALAADLGLAAASRTGICSS